MEALQMTQENRSMQDLGNELSVIHEAYGISYQSIADAAQVNRSYVSTLANPPPPPHPPHPPPPPPGGGY